MQAMKVRRLADSPRNARRMYRGDIPGPGFGQVFYYLGA